MKIIWTVTIYNDLGQIIDYASFDTKAEASIYGRSYTAGDYSRNFVVKKIEC